MDHNPEIAVVSAVLETVPDLFIGHVFVEGVNVSDRPAWLEQRIAALFVEWRTMDRQALLEGADFTAYRELHRRFSPQLGKVTPAAESLIRRCVERGALMAINSAVDIANFCVLRTRRPLGLFATEAIEFPLVLDRSGDGDEIVPIGKVKPERIPAGAAVLRDARGIISLFGTRDSMRTRIRPETEQVLVLSWGARGIERATIRDAVGLCAALLAMRPEGA